MPETNAKDKSRKDEETDSTALALPSFGFPRTFEDFWKPFDQFMEPFFPSSMRSFWTEIQGRQPNVDVQDRGDHFVLTAELPGFDRKDVEVTVTHNVLELKAEKRTEKEDKSDNGTQRQASHSYFHRYMTLPEEVLSEKVDGTMKNGVLELKLPKREPKRLDKTRRVALK